MVAAAVLAMSVFECCVSRGTSHWKTCCWHVFHERPKRNDHTTNAYGKDVCICILPQCRKNNGETRVNQNLFGDAVKILDSVD